MTTFLPNLTRSRLNPRLLQVSLLTWVGVITFCGVSLAALKNAAEIPLVLISTCAFAGLAALIFQAVFFRDSRRAAAVGAIIACLCYCVLTHTVADRVEPGIWDRSQSLRAEPIPLSWLSVPLHRVMAKEHIVWMNTTILMPKQMRMDWNGEPHYEPTELEFMRVAFLLWAIVFAWLGSACGKWWHHRQTQIAAISGLSFIPRRKASG